MRCPYPDCQGEVLEDETVCEECGRSLAPQTVAAAKAGMAARGAWPGVLPEGSSAVAHSAAPAVVPTPVRPAGGSTPAPEVNLLPWLAAGLLGLFLLSVLACLGLGTLGVTLNRSQAAALTPTPPTLTFTFQLSDLTAANNFTAVQQIPAAGGAAPTLLSLRPGYTYAQQGSPDLFSTVELRLDNTLVLELAASAQAVYAQTNPQYAVAQADQTYTPSTAAGWPVRVTVTSLALDAHPQLANGTTGPQPIFTTLALQVAVTPAARAGAK